MNLNNFIIGFQSPRLLNLKNIMRKLNKQASESPLLSYGSATNDETYTVSTILDYFQLSFNHFYFLCLFQNFFSECEGPYLTRQFKNIC